jgi:hypothetical protein
MLEEIDKMPVMTLDRWIDVFTTRAKLAFPDLQPSEINVRYEVWPKERPTALQISFEPLVAVKTDE